MIPRLTTDEERQVWLQCLQAAATMWASPDCLVSESDKGLSAYDLVSLMADRLFARYQDRV
jgi:hypothetical protein